MAQVAQSPQLRIRIEHALASLRREWQSIPELAAEWGEWDEHSRFVFALDWPVCEDSLHQLREWAEQDVLTPEQRAQYDELLELVARNRPVLGQLLDTAE
jgi:predicted TIM-barrel fold metal-dependent hydrolase